MSCETGVVELLRGVATTSCIPQHCGVVSCDGPLDEFDCGGHTGI